MLSAPFKIRLNVKLGHVGLYSPMNEKTPELKCFLCKKNNKPMTALTTDSFNIPWPRKIT